MPLWPGPQKTLRPVFTVAELQAEKKTTENLTLTLRQALPLPHITRKMEKYGVKQVSEFAGVSIRTLHLYDRMGLLTPSCRAESGYRYYGQQELLRLQQVLFYKELGFPLKDIADILDDPDFNLAAALQYHKKSLRKKQQRLGVLIKTIDKTLYLLKNNTMIHGETLYEGMPKEQAAAYRAEAVRNYGEEAVNSAENHLQNLDKASIRALVKRQKELGAMLYETMALNPDAPRVQELVAMHYQNTRKLWGTHGMADPQAEAYKGLGLLYLTDERFTLVNNEYNREFSIYLSKAMEIFAETLADK